MAIEYVGKAFVMNTVSGTAMQVPMPSTAAAGDRIFVVTGSIGSTSGSLPTPSGWAKIAEEVAGTALRGSLFVKTAVGGDSSATYTWNFPNAGRNFGYAVAYRGVDVAAANLAQAASFTDDDNGPWSSPSLALNAGDWLLTAVVARQNPGTSGTHNWTTDAGTDVERYDLFTDVGTNISISGGLWDSGAPLAAGSYSRAISSNVNYSQEILLAARIPVAVDSGGSSGGNPWTHMGLPLR